MKLLFLRILARIAGMLTKHRGVVVRRVLVIKPDHLGDLLLATPALAALRQALPAARLVGLIGPWARLIWQRSPDLDSLIELPFPGFERGQAQSRLGPYLLLLKYALLLRRGGYDAALILRDDHWWGAALAALAGIPRRVGYAHPLCAPLLTAALPYDPAAHVTRQALALVAALLAERPEPNDQGQPGAGASSGLRPGSFAPPLRFLSTPGERAWADGWLESNLASGERLVVLHPGTGGPTKHWVEGRWARVADALAATPGVRMLLTGGPGEADLVARIAGLMRQPALTLVGQTNVGQLAALLGRAALVLGVDSGPLHIAVSQGTPSLHLFGPSDQRRFGPWGAPARHVVLRSGLFCSPCGVFSACPRGTAGPECMAQIEVAQLLEVARGLLQLP